MSTCIHENMPELDAVNDLQDCLLALNLNKDEDDSCKKVYIKNLENELFIKHGTEDDPIKSSKQDKTNKCSSKISRQENIGNAQNNNNNNEDTDLSSRKGTSKERSRLSAVTKMRLKDKHTDLTKSFSSLSLREKNPDKSIALKPCSSDCALTDDKPADASAELAKRGPESTKFNSNRYSPFVVNGTRHNHLHLSGCRIIEQKTQPQHKNVLYNVPEEDLPAPSVDCNTASAAEDNFADNFGSPDSGFWSVHSESSLSPVNVLDSISKQSGSEGLSLGDNSDATDFIRPCSLSPERLPTEDDYCLQIREASPENFLSASEVEAFLGANTEEDLQNSCEKDASTVSDTRDSCSAEENNNTNTVCVENIPVAVSQAPPSSSVQAAVLPVIVLCQPVYVSVAQVKVPNRNLNCKQTSYKPILPKLASSAARTALKKSLDGDKKRKYQEEIYKKNQEKKEVIVVKNRELKQTNLHTAAKDGNKELVFCLVEIHLQLYKESAMAAINARDKFHKTAKDYAADELISQYLGSFQPT